MESEARRFRRASHPSVEPRSRRSGDHTPLLALHDVLRSSGLGHHARGDPVPASPSESSSPNGVISSNTLGLAGSLAALDSGEHLGAPFEFSDHRPSASHTPIVPERRKEHIAEASRDCGGSDAYGVLRSR